MIDIHDTSGKVHMCRSLAFMHYKKYLAQILQHNHAQQTLYTIQLLCQFEQNNFQTFELFTIESVKCV